MSASFDFNGVIIVVIGVLIVGAIGYVIYIWLKTPVPNSHADEPVAELEVDLSRQGNIRKLQALEQSFRLTLEVSLRSGDLDGLAAACTGLGMVLLSKGDYSQAEDFYSRALGCYKQTGNRVGQALVLTLTANSADHRGDYGIVESLCRESMALVAHGEDHQLKNAVLLQLAQEAVELSEYEQAEKLYHEAAAMGERYIRIGGISSALVGRGVLAIRRGEYAEAERMYSESLELCMQAGAELPKALTLCCLGVLAHRRGDYDTAERLLAECSAVFDQADDASLTANFLQSRGELASDRGDYVVAERLLRESFEIGRRLGSWKLKAEPLRALANLFYLGDRLTEAEESGQQLTGLLAQTKGGDRRALISLLRAENMDLLARLAHRKGDYPNADRLFEQSLQFHERAADPLVRAMTLRRFGGFRREQERLAEAAALVTESLEVCRKLGAKAEEAAAQCDLGLIRAAQTRTDEAKALLTEALSVFERIGDYRAPSVRDVISRL